MATIKKINIKTGVTIKQGSKTGTATSSYKNVADAVAANKASKGSSIKQAAPAPAPTPAAKPAASTPAPSVGDGGLFQHSFFSYEGQKERLKNVGATFKALLPQSIGGDTIKLVNPKTGLILADVTIPVKGAVLTSAAYATYGAGVMGLGALKGATGATIATKAAATGASWKTVLMATGGGLIAGTILNSGNRAAPQTLNQQPSAAPVSYQISEQYDYSQRPQSSEQTTYNLIRDSPGAYLSSSPSVGQYSGAQQQTPTQSVPISQDLAATQSQAIGENWLIPALIVGAALIFSKN